MPTSTEPAVGRGAVLAAIANRVVQIHRECYGRGATKARTVWVDEYISVYLEDLFTPVERTLIDAGRGDVVRTTRTEFQTVTQERFRAAIEELTGRRVRAFVSAIHLDPEMAIEIFVLED